MEQGRQYIRKQNPVYLLFWPVYGLRYLLVESAYPAGEYHPVWSSLDEKIPFLEVFFVPYILWYFCIIGVHLWLYIRNDPAYENYSAYLMVTTVITTVLFLCYPTCQNLRPEIFPRDNFLTDAMGLLYRIDTNTNVCPSEHVIGSAGFFFGIMHSASPSKKARIVAAAAAVMTAVSTVFLKQHSVMDVIAAVPVCGAGWYAAFYGKQKKM